MFNKESWNVLNYYQEQQGYHKAHGDIKLARFYVIAIELLKKELSIEAGDNSYKELSVKEILGAVVYYEQQLCFEKARNSTISKYYEKAIEVSGKEIPQQIKLAI